MLAISKAGHDKGKLYFILKEEGEILYLADGITRTEDHPKKKKRKHTEPVRDDTVPANNEEIRQLVRKKTKDMGL